MDSNSNENNCYNCKVRVTDQVHFPHTVDMQVFLCQPLERSILLTHIFVKNLCNICKNDKVFSCGTI